MPNARESGEASTGGAAPEAHNRCPRCGHPYGRHERDEYTLDPVCPVFREESVTPPGEFHQTPRGDY